MKSLERESLLAIGREITVKGQLKNEEENLGTMSYRMKMACHFLLLVEEKISGD